MNQNLYKHLLNLRPGDLIRGNRIVLREQIFMRFFLFIKSFFYNLFSKRQYSKIQELAIPLKEMIHLMDQIPSDQIDPILIKNFLVIEANLLNSFLKKELPKFVLFLEFQQKLRKKQSQTQRLLENSPKKHPLELQRWIGSNEFQRKFACYHGYHEVPLKVEEVPAGAILLTNVHSLIRGLRIQGKKVQKKHWFLLFKAYLYQLFTGSPLIHAELSLGKGEFFHLDNKQEIFQCIVKEVAKGKVCYQYDILFPEQEKILNAFRASNPKYPVHNFDQFMKLLIHEAKTQGVRIKIRSYQVVIKIGMSWRKRFPLRRRKAWLPGKVDYTCSGTISALFAHFGVDFAKVLKKIPDDLSPADLKKTPFFKPFHSKRVS